MPSGSLETKAPRPMPHTSYANHKSDSRISCGLYITVSVTVISLWEEAVGPCTYPKERERWRKMPKFGQKNAKSGRKMGECHQAKQQNNMDTRDDFCTHLDRLH